MLNKLHILFIICIFAQNIQLFIETATFSIAACPHKSRNADG